MTFVRHGLCLSCVPESGSFQRRCRWEELYSKSGGGMCPRPGMDAGGGVAEAAEEAVLVFAVGGEDKDLLVGGG
jgi:hypothetical protein